MVDFSDFENWLPPIQPTVTRFIMPWTSISGSSPQAKRWMPAWSFRPSTTVLPAAPDLVLWKSDILSQRMGQGGSNHGRSTANDDEPLFPALLCSPPWVCVCPGNAQAVK